MSQIIDAFQVIEVVFKLLGLRTLSIDQFHLGLDFL
jgi:hypothetical protein